MKIVVLAGGTSTERTISIVSGTGICKALRQKGHQAVLADIFCGVENVEWEDPFPQEYDVDAASAYMSGFNDKIEEMKKERRSFFGPNILQLCEQADVVFLGLHGKNGEDGKVQATFDLLGIPYTGSKTGRTLYAGKNRKIGTSRKTHGLFHGLFFHLCISGRYQISSYFLL